MTMIETAEVVCERYGISRDAQDAYALQSQRRTAEAQVKGLFNVEIAPLATSMTVVDKASGAKMQKSVTLKSGRGREARYDARRSRGAQASSDPRAAHRAGPVHHCW